ncbi:hypothetical protein [Flavobacterium hydrophilum]|uniref:Uncharacterized protein n=1 Tax=Flavobacterium hydrophilum TaxID=2211445 RepID=A0A2V4BZM6_9FLAO|nr:hypothetical protein [Flavobacterium hydrophilum]PXY44501.1 hypothetical protein DMB68_13620 [Flavobacterium hydrophilum]
MIKKSLKKDWLMLMGGMKDIASKYPIFKVEVTKESHIIINKDWDIICHFINNEYVEVVLTYKNEPCMTVRHLQSYSATASAVLQFIEDNL